MKVLIIGLGVIGTTYGYVFQKEGHKVEHLIRDSKKAFVPENINVKLLDGRFNNKGEEKNDNYKIHISNKNSSYDFILVSVPAGKIEGVIRTLKENDINGTLIIFNGIWEDKSYIENLFKGWEYILGYPVAGGNISDHELNCCIFDHIMLESEEKTNIKNYDKLLKLLSDCHIKAEIPFDMLEWIWIHMAINAAVITNAGEYGDIKNTTEAAEKLMDSSKILSETILTVRETVKIISSRNVNIKNYNNELFAYKMPSKLAGIVMKRMFKNNQLTRRIMTLHNNINDLLYVCKNVYDCGKNNQMDAPLFSRKYNLLEKKINC